MDIDNPTNFIFWKYCLIFIRQGWNLRLKPISVMILFFSISESNCVIFFNELDRGFSISRWQLFLANLIAVSTWRLLALQIKPISGWFFKHSSSEVKFCILLLFLKFFKLCFVHKYISVFDFSKRFLQWRWPIEPNPTITTFNEILNY